jgi:metal-responsive CopG/Arc/MetJ family transcriptional regulator
MAAQKRVCITMDEETLRLADREARRLKTSRNEFIRAAVRAEVNSVATQKENERRQQHRATAGVRNIVKKAGK